MNFDTIIKNLENAIKACYNLGGTHHKINLGKPASSGECEEVEGKLGNSIPEGLKRVISEFASSIEFDWFLPGNMVPPPPFDHISSGYLSWNIKKLFDLEANRKSWIDTVFTDPEDKYARLWHHSFSFMSIVNGDMLAIDTTRSNDGPVVYLSHEKSMAHGYVLAENFLTFISNWSELGCPGPEFWQMMPFIGSNTSGIDPECPNALQWKEWFGIKNN